MLNKLTITEKFRPKTINDLVLLDETKELLRNIINQEQCTHILLSGRAGCGKTSTARVLANELDADLLAMNACEVSTEEFRNKIKKFTTSLNLFYEKQVVLLDEADSLSPKIQKEMKFFLENECINTCVIMTTNEIDKIIDAIRSRCIEIDYDFELSDENSYELKKMIFERVRDEIKTEKREIEEKSAMRVINRFYPDLRRIINYLSVQM